MFSASWLFETRSINSFGGFVVEALCEHFSERVCSFLEGWESEKDIILEPMLLVRGSRAMGPFDAVSGGLK